MSTAELCDLLEIQPQKLYMRCSVHRGNHFTWLTREILCNDWYGIGIEGQKYLKDLLKVLMLTPNMRGMQLTSELFINGMICYKIPYINVLGVMYARESPFITQKEGK